MTNLDLSDTFLRCLSVEKTEDYEQTAKLLSSTPHKSMSANGLAILNLIVSNIRTGIGGKQIVELVVHPAISGKGGENIEIGNFKVGDIVKLDRYGGGGGVKKLKNSSKKDDTKEAENAVAVDAVVISISARQINVAVSFDSTTAAGSAIEDRLYSFYESDVKVWLVQLSNEITYNRMESTMRKLGELNEESANDVVKLVLGRSQFVAPNSASVQTTKKAIKWYNETLNDSQKTAIAFSLQSNLSIVHGPPGTGKTSTLVELVRQAIVQKRVGEQTNRKRILICGPSNISIDTIVERLSAFYPGSAYSKLVRIGHPARILPQILKHSLDLIAENDSGDVLKGILSDINQLTKKTKKIKNYRERREAYQEIKELKKDLRTRSKKAVNDVLVGSDVVVATLHGSSARDLVNCIREHGDLFDVLIIDEVSQALEPSCWIPLIYHQSLKKLIIAGDNKQLAPTLKTRLDAKVVKTLSKTLFDRLIEIHKNHEQFTCFLNIQYRMNEKIMRFSSEELYGGRLVADESVKDKKVRDLLEGDDDDDDVNEEIIWYDTQGGDFPERDDDDDGNGGRGSLQSSKYNDGECLVVLKHVKSLIETHGLKQEDIGIISPYSAQVSKLRKLVREGEDGVGTNYKNIEISTVDGFQGREKEIIILSLVRSNDGHDVGFLKDIRRLNVSITRCKKQLCVVGDMETLTESKVAFLKKWCEWCEDNVEVRYVDVSEL